MPAQTRFTGPMDNIGNGVKTVLVSTYDLGHQPFALAVDSGHWNGMNHVVVKFPSSSLYAGLYFGV